MSVEIIAEIGVNHNADLELAFSMIEKAAKSGADIIKFQTAIPKLVQTANAPMAEYQVINTGNKVSQLEMSKKLHFPLEVFSRLKSEVESYGKVFMSTAFDLVSLDFLTSLGERTFKVPSGELTNLPYLRKIGSKANKVFMSTGMATFSEVEDALKVILNCGLERNQVTILQCNTEYPTPFEDVNLRAMVSMGERLNVKFGYSDHTPGIEASLAAVALGASVIEKHFTLDKELKGPDHKASLNHIEFESLVGGIRNVEKALGGNLKKPSPSEIKNKILARRSVYTSKNISKGEIISLDNLVVLRPENGFSPMRIDELLGKKAVRQMPPQFKISLNDVE
jgi:N,N'-diacetyllegionaminate synthase